jgi:integrase/recombinase XerD
MKTVLGVRFTGPLEPFVHGFAAELTRLGYTRLSVVVQLRLAAHLSRWVAGQGIDAATLTDAVVGRFLAARRAAGYTALLTPAGLAPLLGYLRGLQVVPPAEQEPKSMTVADVLLERYRGYLLGERGLAPGTVRWCVARVRTFVTAHIDPDDVDGGSLRGLTSGDVAAFVLRTCRDLSPKAAQQTASAMRSLLRFLHYAGVLPVSLLGAVPKVANRGPALPRFVASDQVQQLLASCDRESPAGLRDLAMMTMMVRLGLRGGEVAALRLEDLDWRHGEIIVRGKGPRTERLPLPADVGAVIAAYLQRGRPVTALDRSVFVRVKAPHEGVGSSAVRQAVYAASLRAGLAPVAAHRLRHTAATSMLRAGASLAEVGQVLRHRRAQTTTVYAAVDTDRLRTLARPWPAGVS